VAPPVVPAVGLEPPVAESQPCSKGNVPARSRATEPRTRASVTFRVLIRIVSSIIHSDGLAHSGERAGVLPSPAVPDRRTTAQENRVDRTDIRPGHLQSSEHICATTRQMCSVLALRRSERCKHRSLARRAHTRSSYFFCPAMKMLGTGGGFMFGAIRNPVCGGWL